MSEEQPTEVRFDEKTTIYQWSNDRLILEHRDIDAFTASVQTAVLRGEKLPMHAITNLCAFTRILNVQSENLEKQLARRQTDDDAVIRRLNATIEDQRATIHVHWVGWGIAAVVNIFLLLRVLA